MYIKKQLHTTANTISQHMFNIDQLLRWYWQWNTKLQMSQLLCNADTVKLRNVRKHDAILIAAVSVQHKYYWWKLYQ